MPISYDERLKRQLEKQGYIRVSVRDPFHAKRRCECRLLVAEGLAVLSFETPSYLTYSKVSA